MRAEAPPLAWILLTVRCLGTSERLSRLLWQEVEAPVQVRWHLACYSAQPTPARLQGLLEAITPQRLLDASERLCASGRCKRTEIAPFQDEVLRWARSPRTWI